jgi:hypothetical protein
LAPYYLVLGIPSIVWSLKKDKQYRSSLNPERYEMKASYYTTSLYIRLTSCFIYFLTLPMVRPEDLGAQSAIEAYRNLFTFPYAFYLITLLFFIFVCLLSAFVPCQTKVTVTKLEIVITKFGKSKTYCIDEITFYEIRATRHTRYYVFHNNRSEHFALPDYYIGYDLLIEQMNNLGKNLPPTLHK